MAFSGQAIAANYFYQHSDQGLESKSFRSPGGYDESCIIPKPFPRLSYSANELKGLRALCELDHYDYSPRANIAMCPKTAPTNPGLLYYRFGPNEAKSRKDYENRFCKRHKNKRPGRKLAKLKSGITCSYTPSNLAYYQVAKVLGDVLDIPKVVLRTMDKNEHYKYVKKAQATATDTVAKSAWGYNWQFMYDNPNSASNRSGSTRPPRVFTEDRRAIYGALMKNPNKESKYSEMNGYRSYKTRYSDYKRTSAYRNVADSKSITSRLRNNLSHDVQLITQMKDVSDMIVIDTLLSQQDRPGNIHYRPFAFYTINGIAKFKQVEVSGKQIADEDMAKIRAQGGVDITLVKKMIIKDTDCGVAKSNEARNHSWIEGVRHIDPKTYYGLLWLADIAQTQEVERYFKGELLFSDSDWRSGRMSFTKNLKKAVSVLKGNCESGVLHLDLDIRSYVDDTISRNSTGKCELPSSFRP